MENRPLISYILLVYNQERFIREAVAGALAQTYSPLEIILSDDSSTDRTFAIIQEMVGQYSGPHQVRLNRNAQNLGIGGHVNKLMLELAQGELIVMAAGDDISVPERVATIHEAWERTGRKAYSILSGYTRMSAEGVREDTINFPREEFVRESVAEFLKRNRSMPSPGCTQACHRDVFRIFGPLCAAMQIEDNSIMLRARLLGKVLLVNRPLVYWRRAGVVSKARHRDSSWELGESYRRQTREQVLADIQNPAVTARLDVREVRRIRQIARAGLALARTNSLVMRVKGWLMLLPHCSFLENVHNFKLVHRRIAWFGFRRRLSYVVRWMRPDQGAPPYWERHP